MLVKKDLVMQITSRFARTEEFKKIKELEYVDVRYTINNKDGVRYEPWHITTI